MIKYLSIHIIVNLVKIPREKITREIIMFRCMIRGLLLQFLTKVLTLKHRLTGMILIANILRVLIN